MSDEFTDPRFSSSALVTIDVQHDFLDNGPRRGRGYNGDPSDALRVPEGLPGG